MIVLEINLLENFFDFILHIKGGVKCYIISIALIAQLIEQQVSTLKVEGSSLTVVRIDSIDEMHFFPADLSLWIHTVFSVLYFSSSIYVLSKGFFN